MESRFTIQTDYKTLGTSSSHPRTATLLLQTILLWIHYHIKTRERQSCSWCFITTIRSFHSSLSWNFNAQISFLDQRLQEIHTYPELINLHKLITADPSKYPDMHIRDGLLYKKGKLSLGANSPLKLQLLHEFHSTPVGGHGGISKTFHRISSYLLGSEWNQM